jgi:hypothetical protein
VALATWGLTLVPTLEGKGKIVMGILKRGGRKVHEWFLKMILRNRES